MTSILRLGVCDRGESAVRVFNAVGELNHAGGAAPIASVLLCCDGDGQPWYGREADDLLALPADAVGGSAEAFVAALQRAHVDTVWLGRQLPVARVDLIAACEAGGVAVVGPDAATLRRLADRSGLARWSEGRRTLSSGRPARQAQVDFVADAQGTVWVLGARDATACAGGIALLAEAPAPGIDARLADRLRVAATALVHDLGYRGAGTLLVRHDGVDFVLEAIDPVAAPDHATTEERSGVSLIGWRLRVQRGEALPATAPREQGAAVEARLRAEIGSGEVARIALLSSPVGTGVRIDATRRPGDRVDAGDPLLAVVTAWGPDRQVALARVRRALERTAVVLDGAASNRTQLLALLKHTDFLRGEATDGWAEQVLAARPPLAANAVVLLTAAAEAYEADRALAQSAFYAKAARGRPEQPPEVGRRIELHYHGVSYALEVACIGPQQYAVRQGAHAADLSLDALNAFERRVTCGGRRHRVLVAPTPSGWRIECDGQAHRVEREDGVALRADRPALVVSVLAKPGAELAAGAPIAVLESMKMESTLSAPMAGQVVSVAIAPNQQIESGALLLRLRPQSGAAAGAEAGGTPVDWTGLEAVVDFTVKACERVYGPLGHYLLGYDLPRSTLQKVLTQQRRIAEIAAPDDAALLACEDGLLDIYADLGVLYRPPAEAEPDDLTARVESTQEHLIGFLQWLDADRAALPAGYRAALRQALARYGVPGLERTALLESALMRLFRSFARLDALGPVVSAILQRRLACREQLGARVSAAMRPRLERLLRATQGRLPAIADLVRDLIFHCFDEPALEATAAHTRAEMAGHLALLAQHPDAPDRAARIESVAACPQPIRSLLLDTWLAAGAPAAAQAELLLELHLQRIYRGASIGAPRFGVLGEHRHAQADVTVDDTALRVFVGYLPLAELPGWMTAFSAALSADAGGRTVVLELSTWRAGEPQEVGETAAEVAAWLARCTVARPPRRIDVAVTNRSVPRGQPLRTHNVSFSPRPGGGFGEDALYRDLHPMLAERLEIWRLANFELEPRPAPEDVHLFLGVATSNRDDRRLFALAEIRDLMPLADPTTGEVSYPRLERTGLLALAAMRSELARHAPRERPVANRLVLDVHVPWTLPDEQVQALAHRFAPLATRVGLEKVVLKVRRPAARANGGDEVAVLQFEDVGHTILVTEGRAGDEPIRPLGAYQQKVLAAARTGAPYPYEIVRLLTQRRHANGLPADRFDELDLDAEHRLVPVQREPGRNRAHIVIGLVTNHTPVVPEGMTRVAMLSDPTQGLGNLAEPECRRINAALAYALERRLPVEWFAVSSGALISMDSGTENMDWIARTLRALIEFTQAGGEINIVVTGINVGGQPYWNAEATMLTHTKGILVMSPASTMVLTGKQALDFSGAVSAEDNFGIGGYDRIMGPNGQGQYWAPSFPEACELLLRHYEYCYVVPGERFPRRRPTRDPSDRDVRASPHRAWAESPFRSVGDIFSPALNAERKQPFDMRSVMRAVADADAEPLERWKDLRDGDTSIVWDTTVGGIPVCMLGIEAHKVARKGFVPADGPPAWTSGTLFPQSSRKTARAINAASGMRPLVVLANLSGFDGSPESMRRRQLEYGAEIGRAVTNFRGPIVFVVVSRYHGGAFVVFSKWLNASMEIAAIEGSVASVIGGTPAAATVFAREVKQRTDADPRVAQARKALAAASGAGVAQARAALAQATEQVRSAKLGEVAAEFDAIHTIERALRVGSVDRIIEARELRPYVIDALERGMAREAGPGPAR